MIEGHAHAGVARPGGLDHCAIFRCIHRGSAGDGVVLSNMDLRSGTCRIVSPTIRAGDVSGSDRVYELEVSRQRPKPAQILAYQDADGVLSGSALADGILPRRAWRRT